MFSESKLPVILLLLAASGLLIAKTAKKLIAPVKGFITSAFGERINPVTMVKEFHNGIDIEVPEGTSIKAPEAGKVTNVYQSVAGGNQLVIQHPDGYVTGYAHLSKSLVKINDTIHKGQLIALSGKTGEVTGAHLHFSLRDKSGKYINPATVFSFS